MSTKKPQPDKGEISPLKPVGPGTQKASFHRAYRRVIDISKLSPYAQISFSNSEGNRFIYNQDL